MSILIGYTKEGKNIHIYDYNDEEVYCCLGHLLIAKKGNKKIWHYSHLNNEKEDCCNKEKSSWHLWWQTRVKKQYIEIHHFTRIDKKIYHNIADIKNKDGIVIEIQYSPINIEKIKERETVYEKMCWIFSGDKIDIIEKKRDKNKIIFSLIGGCSSFLDTTKKTFIDFNKRGLIEIISKKKKSEIEGKIITLDIFDKEYFNDILIENYDKRLNSPEQ